MLPFCLHTQNQVRDLEAQLAEAVAEVAATRAEHDNLQQAHIATEQGNAGMLEVKGLSLFLLCVDAQWQAVQGLLQTCNSVAREYEA